MRSLKIKIGMALFEVILFGKSQVKTLIEL